MAAAGKGVSQVMNRCEMAKATGYLDLSDCGLLYVADAIYLVLKEYKIAKCNLKNNGLKKFPKKMIERLPDIMLLNLENNKLTEIPDEVAMWSQMRALNISRNQLTTFPEVIFKLEMLQFLDVGENEIEELDFERLRTSLPALKQLSVHGNPLADKEITREAVKSAAEHDLLIRTI